MNPMGIGLKTFFYGLIFISLDFHFHEIQRIPVSSLFKTIVTLKKLSVVCCMHALCLHKYLFSVLK